MNPKNQEVVWLIDSSETGTPLTGVSDYISAYFLIVILSDYFVNMFICMLYACRYRRCYC